MKRKFGARFSFLGYLLFLIPISLTVCGGIVLYSSLLAKKHSLVFIAIFLVIYVLIITLFFSLIDIIRRRLMVDRPVEQILDATQKIAMGDFKTRLNTLHSFYKYDEYDLIIENINKMMEELSKSEILKTDFISNVSHEIKTPLSIIKTYATALKNKNLDEATKLKYLNTLVVTSEKLSNLITNILKLNKLENQAIIADKQYVNLGELLRENVLQFEELFEKKSIKLNCEIEDIYTRTVQSYVEIIFNNIVSNAIKFTDVGGHIDIYLKEIDNNIVFIVKDDGCGMSSEVGKRIFEKFYQGDKSHSSEGNGLGLALVKKVIDVLGGEIHIESEEGKGSLFKVKLKRESNE